MPHPYPHIRNIYTADSESDLDTDDTDSEISIVPHSQDEGTLSAEDTPARIFHIPISPPPRTLSEPLPGPFKINTTNNNTKAVETHQQPVQQTVPANPQLKPTCKTPLLPTPAAPVRQFSGQSVLPRPSSQNNSQNHYKHFIPGPSSHNNSQNHYIQFIPGPSLHNNSQNHYKQFIPRPHDHHYYQLHHTVTSWQDTRYQHIIQDFTHISYHKYQHIYQFYYHTPAILSPHYSTCMQHKDKEEEKTQPQVKR